MPSSNGIEVREFLQEKLKDFCKEEDIGLDFKFVSWNRAYEAIIMDFKNGEYPDVIQLGSTWIRPMAHLRYIAPILEDISFKPALTGWLNEYCMYNGKQVAVPWVIDTMIMAVRKDLMKKLEINPGKIRNWHGFYQEIKRLALMRRKDKSLPKPLMFAIRPEMETVHRMSALFFAAGYSYPELKLPLKSFLANKNFIKVVKYLRDLLEVAGLNSSDADIHPYKVNEGFYLQDASVFYIGNWYGVIADLLKNKEESKYKVLPLPSPIENGGTYTGASILAVSTKSRFPGKSARLIERLVDQEFIEEWQYFTNAISAFDSGFWQERFNNKEINALYKTIINSSSYPIHPVWRNIEKILSVDISKCLWQLFIESDIPFEKRAYGILEKSDQNIKKLLKMVWELD